MIRSESITEQSQLPVASSSSRVESATAYYASDESDADSDANFDGKDADGGDEEYPVLYNELGARVDKQGNLLHADMITQIDLTKAKNREHAKNTRIRKKNYIETLKDDIQQLSNAREARERDRKAVLSKLVDQVSVRKKALATWFSYRVNMELNPEKWQTILDDSFEFIIPVTPYRSFPPQQVQDGRRKVVGISAMIFDALSLNVMVQSIVLPRTAAHNAPKVTLQYEISQESIVSEDTIMCKWRIRTENVAARGGLFEIAKQGMLLATFSAENKLRSVEVSFDVMSFMQQLRHTSEREAFQVMPNTVYTATAPSSDNQAPPSPSSSRSSLSGSQAGSTGSRNEALGIFTHSAEPRIVVSATPPYAFLFINKKFQEVFRHDKAATELLTRDKVSMFDSLIAKDGNKQALSDVQMFLKNMQPCCAILHCRTGGEQPVTHLCCCSFYPLFAEGAVQQYLVILEVVGGSSGHSLGDSEGMTIDAALNSAEVGKARKKQGYQSSSSIAGSMRSDRSGSSGSATISGVTDRASNSSLTLQTANGMALGSAGLGPSGSSSASFDPMGRSRVLRGQSLASSLDQSLSSHSRSQGYLSEMCEGLASPIPNSSNSKALQNERRAASAMQQSLQNAATDRWMQDVSSAVEDGVIATHPGQSRGSHKATREGRVSPDGAVNKSKRTDIAEVSSGSGLSGSGSNGSGQDSGQSGVSGEGESGGSMDTRSASLSGSGSGTASGTDSANDGSPMHTPEFESSDTAPSDLLPLDEVLSSHMSHSSQADRPTRGQPATTSREGNKKRTHGLTATRSNGSKSSSDSGLGAMESLDDLLDGGSLNGNFT